MADTFMSSLASPVLHEHSLVRVREGSGYFGLRIWPQNKGTLAWKGTEPPANSWLLTRVGGDKLFSKSPRRRGSVVKMKAEQMQGGPFPDRLLQASPCHHTLSAPNSILNSGYWVVYSICGMLHNFGSKYHILNKNLRMWNILMSWYMY